MVTAVGYLYPWDVDGTDPAAIERVVATGVDSIALAAAYHATRAGTPEHPSRRFVDAAHPACYVPVRPEAWAGRRLVPAAPDWAEPDSAPTAAARLRAAGLDVQAWLVLTHNSRLGAGAPDLVVRNAFGERYPYALCPSHDEVVDYCRTLAAEVVAHTEPDGVVLEACGPLGAEHRGVHEKTDFAGWTPEALDLLSLCFCAACSAAYRRAGLEPDEVAAAVRAALAAPAPAGPDDVLGAAAEVLHGVRTAAAGRLLDAVVDALPPLRVTVHASARRWAVGSFPHLDAAALAGVDTVVASCWGAPQANAAGVAELAGRTPAPRRIGGYVRPDTAPGTGAAELLAAYRVDEVHLYHLGLVPAAGRTRLAEYAHAIHTVR